MARQQPVSSALGDKNIFLLTFTAPKTATLMTNNALRVFISYAHESDALRQSVWDLAKFLRSRWLYVLTDHPYINRAPMGMALTLADILRYLHALNHREQMEPLAVLALQQAQASGIPAVMGYVVNALVKVGLINPDDFK